MSPNRCDGYHSAYALAVFPRAASPTIPVDRRGRQGNYYVGTSSFDCIGNFNIVMGVDLLLLLSGMFLVDPGFYCVAIRSCESD
jgi:hypothetical protein